MERPIKVSWSPILKPALVIAAIALVIGVFIWQALTASGNPDPAVKGLSPAAAILSTGVLVFREGLEAILVLATVTAGMARTNRKDYLRAVPAGASVAFVATLVTWFAVVAVISGIKAHLRGSAEAVELNIQAGTGLLAIVVLLVVMNWFFHKVYWTGWIGGLNEKRKQIMESAAQSAGTKTFMGLALLGFAAIYREGFEIVLFLQDLRLKAGNAIVLEGTLIGLGLTGIVAALTFLGHKKLPYKNMLIITGILLGFVLLVMVGEEAQEMQLAGWIATTNLHVHIPDWMGLWFSLFPTAQTIAAQVIAAVLVIGSYFSATTLKLGRPRHTAA